MLRIIAGKYRHLIIDTPSVNTTKPTTDKVREALMSALGPSINDAVVLDLFAGSGALGIESLSRGASKAYFCDNNRLAFKTIKNNLNRLKITYEALLVYGDYKHMLSYLKDNNIKVDIVFLDPPYALKNVYLEVIDYLLNNEILNSDGILVREWNNLIPEDSRFNYHKAYKYGTVNILIERR